MQNLSLIEKNQKNEKNPDFFIFKKVKTTVREPFESKFSNSNRTEPEKCSSNFRTYESESRTRFDPPLIRNLEF